MKAQTMVGLLVLLALLVGASTYAHHAFSSEFDADRPFTVEGKVVMIEWVNPHAWIHVDVELQDGTIQPWMMEGGTPNALLRAGLTRRLLPPGTMVTVRGYQSKDPDCDPKCRGSGRDILLANGERLFMGSSGAGAPPREARQLNE